MYVYVYDAYQYENVVPNILRVVAGTEAEENKKDLWKMILEVYGALRKCYASYAYIKFISIKTKLEFIKAPNFDMTVLYFIQ